LFYGTINETIFIHEELLQKSIRAQCCHLLHFGAQPSSGSVARPTLRIEEITRSVYEVALDFLRRPSGSTRYGGHINALLVLLNKLVVAFLPSCLMELSCKGTARKKINLWKIFSVQNSV